MGLFGYNQKDFAKSTDAIKTAITAKMEQLAMISAAAGGDGFGIGKLLNAILMKLEMYSFPAGSNKKELEAVDTRINGILTKLTGDFQEKNFAKAHERCMILLSAVEDARQYGKERHTPEELKQLDVMAELKGEIFNALDEKTRLESQRAEILNNAKNATPAQQEKYKYMYDENKRRADILDKNIGQFSSRYNAAADIVAVREVGHAAKKIQVAQLASPQEFAREAAQYSKIIEQEAEKDLAISQTASEFMGGINTTQAKSSFYDELNEVKNNDMMSSINSSKASSSSDTSDFWDQLEKKN